MIYLDHNATTPLDPRVLEAMLPFFQNFHGNASALYRSGRIARSALDNAREKLAALIDARPEQIIFTSGGTEANNLALHQLPNHAKIVISASKHPSVTLPALIKQTEGNDLIISEVDTKGILKADFIDQTLWQKGDMVSVQLANNETGVLQPVDEYYQRLSEKQLILHTDATQAVGKIPVNFSQLPVHLMTLSSHKINGPKGCGALVVAQDFQITPMLYGGGQEQNYRAGTENIAGIVGFGKAAELALAEMTQRQQHLLALRHQLEQGLRNIPDITLFSETVARLPNTIQWGKPNLDGEMLVMQLDRLGIAVSSGSACASGGGKPSQTLRAMGVPEALAKSAVRVSLGYSNTEVEVATFIKTLHKLVG